MADMDVFEFAAMIEESSIETKVMEYYDKNILEAVCLTDVLSDGLSMVYSFFDTDGFEDVRPSSSFERSSIT